MPPTLPRPRALSVDAYHRARNRAMDEIADRAVREILEPAPRAYDAADLLARLQIEEDPQSLAAALRRHPDARLIPTRRRRWAHARHEATILRAKGLL